MENKELKATEADELRFARCMANNIKADGASEAFIKAVESGDFEAGIKFIQAYAIDVARKSEIFTTTYIANPKARSALNDWLTLELSKVVA